MSLRIRRGGATDPGTPPPSGGGYAFPTTAYTFPPMAGVVDVTSYGATGNGTTDDTGAILNAINSNLTTSSTAAKIIWLPGTPSNPKTYLVSNRIARGTTNNWRADWWLQGESEGGVTIKLKDSCAGFTSAASPRGVIFQTSDVPDSGAAEPWTSQGTGAKGFRNMLADLTIDLGSGNAGAVGIDSNAHNLASVRRVTINGTSSGFAGVMATRDYPGPCLFHRITVNGCTYGFYVLQAQYGFTIEHLRLSNQTTAGIRLDKNVLHIRGIESTNTVPAIDIVPGVAPPSAPTTLAGVSLVDANLDGGSGAISAIQNRSTAGKVYLRRVSSSGYRAVLDEGSTAATGTTVTEYATPPLTKPSGGTATGLNLTVNETPESPYPTLGAMSNAQTLVPALSTTVGGADQSANIQAAIDACTTPGLYFPSNAGRWNINGATITIRGNVRHMMWNGGDLFLSGAAYAAKPIFIIDQAIGGDLVIEHLRLDQAGQSFQRMWENRSTHKVTFKDCYMDKYLTGGTGTLGELYCDDVIAGQFTLNRPQNMWARQFNAEHIIGLTKSATGDVWILGWKTEYETQSATLTGGRTEIIGMYTFPDADQNSVVGTNAFTVTNAALSIANMMSFSFTTDYNDFVTEVQGGTTYHVTASSLNPRGSGGHWLSLYRSAL